MLQREQYAELMVRVCRALTARQQFEQTAPKWAQKIGLPLCEGECEALLKDPDKRIRQLGHNALTRRYMGWPTGLGLPFGEAYLRRRADLGMDA